MLEREILGCFLQDNSLLNETILKPSYFSKEENQLLYQSMLVLNSQGKAVDQVSLLSENYDYIKRLGGVSFILEIERTGKVDNFETYERTLIEDYQKRASKQLVTQWLNSKAIPGELIEQLQSIEELSHQDEISKDEVLEQMFDLPYLDAKDAGISTGLKDLDAILGGFQKHSSYILGARPSMGKTATMLKFMLEAIKSGAVPLVFSLEMSKESLLRRLIATIGRINLFRARNPHNLTANQKVTWQKVVERLKLQSFEIYDKPLQTIQYIRSQIRRAKRKHEGKDIIVFIDYLTLIQSNEKYNSDHQKFTVISAMLKAIAQEYDCPVVTLAQLSRGVEQRQDKRPLLSDLRESGSIEQDADVVMFLYREGYYKKDKDDNTLEIIVAKHRDGPTGDVKIYYNKATGEMGDLSDTQGNFG